MGRAWPSTSSRQAVRPPAAPVRSGFKRATSSACVPAIRMGMRATGRMRDRNVGLLRLRAPRGATHGEPARDVRSFKDSRSACGCRGEDMCTSQGFSSKQRSTKHVPCHVRWNQLDWSICRLSLRSKARYPRQI